MSAESKRNWWRWLAVALLCVAVGAVVLLAVPTARGVAVAAFTAVGVALAAALRGGVSTPRSVETREPRELAEAEAEQQRSDLDGLARREAASAIEEVGSTRDELLACNGEDLAEILRRDLGRAAGDSSRSDG